VILLSGIFGSVGEPDWLATLVRYLPARPIFDAAASPTGRDIAVLIVWAAAGLVASLRLFRWEPRSPRRHRYHRGAAWRGSSVGRAHD
jgi:hypothetical protein